MKTNFCTLFNSAYLSRGLVLYESLRTYSADFHLFVLAFDEDCAAYFKQAGLPNLTLISLREFEDEALLQVKPSRTEGEYCWTSTPSLILYCLRTYQLPSCTYLDADMCFYADPAILIQEMGEASVLITDHRYSPAYDQSVRSGKYCVQFMTFVNNEKGILVLNSWREACIDWCYARVEDGKFGDQKYLDEWPGRFSGVHELEHLGGGLAPWNVQQYTFKKTGSGIFGTEISSGREFQVVFFHYHALKFFTDGIVSYTSDVYEINSQAKELLYIPYVRLLKKEKDTVSAGSPLINSDGARDKSPGKAAFFVALLRTYFYDLRMAGRAFWQKLKTRKLHNHYHRINL